MLPLITTALLVAVFITGCDQSSPPSQAEIQAIKDDITNEKTSNTNSFSVASPKELDCEKLCDPINPDYRCLFSGSLGNDRDKQMTEMISKLSAPQPVHISHADILKIFKLTGGGFDSARGETLIANNTLTNNGTASEISSNTTTGLNVALTVPKTVEYDFKQSKSGFTLSSRNDNLFSIHINDPILQRQYGGAAKLISVEPSLSVISTDRGCIAYDPAPQLAGGKIAILFGSSRNPGKHRNKNADLIDDVRASKHI